MLLAWPVCLIFNNNHRNIFSHNYHQELLLALHERHEEWLIQKKFPVPAPVMVSKNILKTLKLRQYRV